VTISPKLTLSALSAVIPLLTAGAVPAAARPASSRPQRSADALHALGVTGVLARLETADGVEVARSGVADLATGAVLPRDPYLRIGQHDQDLAALAMAHPAGERTWSYSNTNYVIAGMLIEAVTGRGWDREVADRIARPLGLRRTSTPGTWPFLPSPPATHYFQFEPGGPLVDTTIAVRGLDSGADGSMISTAGDLNTFFRALLGGRLLPSAVLAQMRQLVTLPDGSGYPSGSGGGLGLFHRPLPCGGGYWGHGGNGFGYTVEPAVTGDGRRALTVSMFAGTLDPERAAAHAPAFTDLVDRALCPPGGDR